MKFIYRNSPYLILLFTFIQISLLAQSKYYQKTVLDTLAVRLDNNYKISSVSIIPFTEKIYLKNKILNRNDYKISYSTGEFSLRKDLKYSALDTLIITYQTFRLSLKKEYKRRSLVYKYNEASKDTIKVIKNESEGLTSESIFGSRMERSGTLVRGFTVGTNQDLALNSGFRLQLSGRLSDDIELVAALTDENTPIQPEGNTEKLDELDKVFIQIKHPRATGTFGDYQLEKRYGEFGVIDRKLQGLMGEYNYGDESAYFSIASSRGKFTTNNFMGQDGVQGPYRLSGANNEPDIVVIAGTEKVYVDGIEMKRGERNDYIIDYDNAAITFTPNRLITSASRISVDFEYSDQQFSRNFLGAGVQTKLFSNKLGIKVQYLQEGDDKSSPINVSLADSDIAVLKNAGNDRNKAAKTGVSLALPDSLGNVHGVYQKIDTVINSIPYSYYKYNPGDSLSIYNVSFSYVGQGKGDYQKQSLGNYFWVGINQGSYAPIIFLPMPQSKQFGNIVLDFQPKKDILISLELAGSNWDQNTYSSINDNTDFGAATNFLISINPQKISVGNINFGKAGLSYQDRFIQSRFSSLDRFNEVEFNRYYNVIDTAESVDEHLRKLDLNYTPIDELNVVSSFGLLRRGNDFKSNRYNNTLVFTDKKDYSIEYNLDYVSTKDISINSDWLRQSGSGYYTIGHFKPGIQFLAENKNDIFNTSDSLLSTSLKYYEVDPFITLIGLKGYQVSVQYSFRDDYSPLNGYMLEQATSTGTSLEFTYNGSNSFNTDLNVTVRNKNYSEAFKKIGNLDNQTILVRSRSNMKLWDPVLSGNFYYEVATQKSAKLQKVFLKVTKGTGNYIYLGDMNHNGIADENEFVPALYDGDYILITVPTEELYPVIDLKTSTYWRVSYAEIFDKNSLPGKILKPVTSETFWRVNENTREPDYKKIYLLQFSAFQNEANTISGSNFIQQDFYLFENNQDFSLRLRFAQTKSLNQYNDGPVRTYNRERSIRIRTRLMPEISNQTDFVMQNDNLTANPLSLANPQRTVTSNSVNTDFSYRPENYVEVGFAFKVGRSTDYFPAVPTVIDLNSESLRMNLSFAGTGRLRIEINRVELNGNESNNYLPFELTQGNVIGKNYFWSVNFDYRIGSNLQSTIYYQGRWQGSGLVVHTLRAEMRAYF